MITDRQKGFIGRIAKEKGLSTQEIDGVVHRRCKSELQNLDRNKASQFIEELRAR